MRPHILRNWRTRLFTRTWTWWIFTGRCRMGALITRRRWERGGQMGDFTSDSLSDALTENRILHRELRATREQLQECRDKPAKTLPRLVVCAILIRDGKVLLERRAPAGVAGLDG